MGFRLLISLFLLLASCVPTRQVPPSSAILSSSSEVAVCEYQVADVGLIAMSFDGNDAVDDEQLCESARGSVSWEFPSGEALRAADLDEAIDHALGAMSVLLLDEGYVNAHVEVIDFRDEDTARGLRRQVRFVVDEGPRFRIRRIRLDMPEVDSNSPERLERVHPEQLMAHLEGAWFSRSEVAGALVELETQMRRRGYPDAEVVLSTSVEMELAHVDFEVSFDLGQRGPAPIRNP